MMKHRRISSFTMNGSSIQSHGSIQTGNRITRISSKSVCSDFSGQSADMTRNWDVAFEAFAVPTIVGEIKRFLRDKTWAVHVPRRIKELGPKIKSAVEALTIEMQRSPLVSEIAEYLDTDEELVLEAMEMGRSYQALSMDHTLEADSEGGTVTLFDIIGESDDGFERTDHRLVVANALNVLSEREKQIIQYTYIEQMSQKEAGERLGISQMHVSRLQRKAIKKLQEAIMAAGGAS